MPNQLAQSKKRKSVAEHAAVLALLERIAASESTTSTDLLRKAAREIIRHHAEDPDTQRDLRQVLHAYEPKLPQRASTRKALARFKRDSREFDALTIELGLEHTEDIQKRNSLHKQSSAPVLIGSL